MTSQQLQLEGIGQQIVTLEIWKNQNKIYTRKPEEDDECDECWMVWSEIESMFDFGNEYGFNTIAFGDTEKEAIENYCVQQEIKRPFWWQ